MPATPPYRKRLLAARGHHFIIVAAHYRSIHNMVAWLLSLILSAPTPQPTALVPDVTTLTERTWNGRWHIYRHPGCPAACGMSGVPLFDIECRAPGNKLLLDDDTACGPRPTPTGTCSSRCLYVDAAAGDNSADATSSSPIRTVTECIQRARVPTRYNLTFRAAGEVHKCLLRGGVYTEVVNVRGLDHISIEAADPEATEPALFDGTDAVTDVSWAATDVADVWKA